MAEIMSPPFPVDTTNVTRLLRLLTDLREWLVDMRFWANETASAHGFHDEVVPSPDKIPPIPDLVRFEMVALPSLMETYMNMRKLRESWDQMVRVYEEDWDSKGAVSWRLQCVRWAYIILMEAFVDPETKEAREEQSKKKAMKFMHRMLRKMGVPKEFLGRGSSMQMTPFGPMIQLSEEHPKNIDFDKLFHGESSEEDEDDDDEEEHEVE